MERYDTLFNSLKEKSEGGFIPFVLLGDPNPEVSERIIETLIESGADALELGVPFSDPIADGPTIQAAHVRALDARVSVADAFGIIRKVRDRHPDLPIGLLIYSNVAVVHGLERFYDEVRATGADSVLLPDVPVRESEPFTAAAKAAGVSPIYIAPPHASSETLEGVAHSSEGYIYAISRDGVTGTERASETTGLHEVVSNLQAYGGAPVVLGFGISTPQHVTDAIAAGASAAISGSAITKIIERHVKGSHPTPRTVNNEGAMLDELANFTREMKAATRAV